VSPALESGVRDILTASESVSKKTGPSGTSSASVAAQRESLRSALAALEAS